MKANANLAFEISMKNAPAPKAVLVYFLVYGVVQNTKCCEDLTCFIDYIETLTCTYKIGHRGTNGMLYNLTTTWNTENPEDMAPCNLIQFSRNGSHAVFTCTISMKYFTSEDKFTVHIMETDGKDYKDSKECPEIAVIENFKPYPPFNLTISLSEDYNICWQTAYESNYLLQDELEYELRYKKKYDTWENHHSVPITRDEKNVLLLQSSFHANTVYVAQVRAKPRSNSDYKGVWSDWSTSLTWKTKEGKGKSFLGSKPWIYVVLSLLGLLPLVIFAFFKLKRIWKQVWALTPDPEPFFKPLYMGHNGDFKSWLGASYTMTIDFFDCGIVLPEILQVYKHIPQQSSKADFKEVDKHHKLSSCKSCLPVHSKEQSKSMNSCVTDGSAIKDKSYGHVSIDTVTVAVEGTPCCPQCPCNSREKHDQYVGDNDDSGDIVYSTKKSRNDHIESELLMADSSAQEDIMSSGSTPMASYRRLHEIESISEPMQGFLRSSLGPNLNILDLLCVQHDEWDLDSPTSYQATHDESISYDSDAEHVGYPRICLDMDTIDSGFVDSDCSSPTESEFEKNNITQTDSSDSSGSVQLQEANQCTRSYVKQWISCTSTTSSSESQMSE
uniref:Interleukin-4 receptor subunit alpha n=1 Tax=Geotrypetes seraphini TaxID=260995 RepID=A0A6P8N5Y6_GEOSA|nr:interleukin-21 receptor isoform X2 [Geotrypetes seraphini]